MGDKIELAEVPARIIQRYLGNFDYLVKQVSSLFGSEN
jgi:outer membrane protein assembly factor BamB